MRQSGTMFEQVRSDQPVAAGWDCTRQQYLTWSQQSQLSFDAAQEFGGTQTLQRTVAMLVVCCCWQLI